METSDKISFLTEVLETVAEIVKANSENNVELESVTKIIDEAVKSTQDFVAD